MYIFILVFSIIVEISVAKVNFRISLGLRYFVLVCLICMLSLIYIANLPSIFSDQ